jgi:hypothetical protein
MEHQMSPRYAHRPNEDGSYDSIFTSCFATVASVSDETELAQHEHGHICNPFWSYDAGR